MTFPPATKPKQQGQPQVVGNDTTRNVTCTTIGALAAFPPTCYFPAFQLHSYSGGSRHGNTCNSFNELLAPKVLTGYRRPMITILSIPSHPLHPHM